MPKTSFFSRTADMNPSSGVSEAPEDIAPEAIGGHSIADLPPGYFRSLPFLATFVVSFQTLTFFDFERVLRFAVF